MVDAGASMSCDHAPVPDDRALDAVGSRQVGTAAGPTRMSLYRARLACPIVPAQGDPQVAGVDLTEQIAVWAHSSR
ncbi:MAG TPA: hypothetical protein VMW47_10925 [Verrucomicrobiae bacterium]|nr:hypothetical protein [Verrucomicrobiae bacterium]